MAFIYVTAAILLGLAFLYAFSSHDLLDHSIPLTFAQLLLKYIPGYAAPLRNDQDGFPFEEIRLEGRLKLSTEEVATFNRAVRSSGSPFLLVAKTTPLVIQLLSDRRCPIKPLGAVNTRNVIHFNKPGLDDLTYAATFGSTPGIRRKRGVEFAITIDIMSAGQPVIQMELWFLQFLPSSRKPTFTGETQAPRTASGDVVTSLEVTPQDPRLWATSCKDYNPIHVSTLGAKLFGFKSVIAHGNHVAALVLQQTGIEVPCTLELDFVRPMLLPATFSVLEIKDVARQLIVVSKEQDRVHLRMTIKR